MDFSIEIMTNFLLLFQFFSKTNTAVDRNWAIVWMITWLASFPWLKTEKGFQQLLNWDSNTITCVKVSMCIL